jgi:hypothetical protein
MNVEEMGRSVLHGSMEGDGSKGPTTNMQNGKEKLVGGGVNGNRR